MTELTQLDEIEENCFDPGRMQYSPKICTLQFQYGIRKLCTISSYQATPDQTANVAETHDPTDLLGSLELCCLRMLA